MGISYFLNFENVLIYLFPLDQDSATLPEKVQGDVAPLFLVVMYPDFL